MSTIDEGKGEFQVNVSSIRQRFLEAFRVRSEHAAAIHDRMRKAIADRLVAEYGNPRAATDAVWLLARENEWLKEGGLAEGYFLNRQPDKREMSIINIVESQDELASLPPGILLTRLEEHSKDGKFTGQHSGPAHGDWQVCFPFGDSQELFRDICRCYD